MHKKTALILIVVLLFSMFSVPQELYAANSAGYAVRGLTRLIYGIIAIPRNILSHSKRVIFPLGILTGTAQGAWEMVSWTLGGAFDLLKGAAPYAKYAVFL